MFYIIFVRIQKMYEVILCLRWLYHIMKNYSRLVEITQKFDPKAQSYISFTRFDFRGSNFEKHLPVGVFLLNFSAEVSDT